MDSTIVMLRIDIPVHQVPLLRKSWGLDGKCQSHSRSVLLGMSLTLSVICTSHDYLLDAGPF